MTTTTRNQLTVCDFDVALALERPVRRSDVIAKLGDNTRGLYATRKYLDRAQPVTALVS
ncbi:hypothetical protein [Rhodococcus wratislaviensis]|uniref:Uncharacterized protein n=1 Tax=Rhodococcus wratislaviensis NBRC 100605 TaxID=1219028 RepID=X0PW16_RHOWR|nr:hypothetical protein [Rhodococcus wratislaviensis]GAF47484.1 hypothetical protein RW1_041_00290 [Rhodococcus wratislaviensis NBRC 100605]